MPRHAFPTRDHSRRALTTVLLAGGGATFLLSGCSSVDALGGTPSTTRMQIQRDVPTLAPDESTDDALARAPTTTPDAVRHAQIWVRSARWQDGTYDLEVAAPHGASYTVADTYSTDGNAPPVHDCSVAHAKLTEKITNAIASVDTLDHVTCVSPRLDRPSLDGAWRDDVSVVDSPRAVFAEGGLKAQGAPLKEGGTAAAVTAVMPQILAVQKQGNEGLDVTVRTAAGAWVSVVTNPDSSADHITCTSTRVGSAPATARGQVTYRLTCPAVPSGKPLGVSSTTAAAVLGQDPETFEATTRLPTSAAASTTTR